MAANTPYYPVTPPVADGDVRVFLSAEAVESGCFDRRRRVLFVNGMDNIGQKHMDSALTLSLLQMCTVVGVYNATSGPVSDVGQCLGDKFQYNGSLYDMIKRVVTGRGEAEVRAALNRNHCQSVLFDLLRRPENRKIEIFAHSQGNLIVSNVLEAIMMVDGADAIKGWKVNTFGSPAVGWPDGLTIQEYGFTFDMVNMLSGPNFTRAISKVGWPSGTKWPMTHGFDWYMKEDPAFTINRFRTGGWGLTFNMDEEGLADCLIAMGVNMRRVGAVFAYLEENHSNDSDDVAQYYLDKVRASRPEIGRALAKTPELRKRLTHILGAGWTSSGEQKDIDYLNSLR